MIHLTYMHKNCTTIESGHMPLRGDRCLLSMFIVRTFFTLIDNQYTWHHDCCGGFPCGRCVCIYLSVWKWLCSWGFPWSNFTTFTHQYSTLMEVEFIHSYHHATECLWWMWVCSPSWLHNSGASRCGNGLCFVSKAPFFVKRDIYWGQILHLWFVWFVLRMGGVGQALLLLSQKNRASLQRN